MNVSELAEYLVNERQVPAHHGGSQDTINIKKVTILQKHLDIHFSHFTRVARFER